MQTEWLGMVPDQQGQIRVSLQYQDGLNLHEYVGSHPLISVDPAGQKGIRTLVNTENLTEPARFAAGTGRGQTNRVLQVSIPCHTNSIGLSYMYVAPHSGCNYLDINITLTVHVQVLRQGHQLWTQHLGRYDNRWGNPRSDTRERAATIAHEYDHRDTYVLGFWPRLQSGSLRLFERLHFCNRDCCGRVSACLSNQINALFLGAIQHSRSFDGPQFWDGGNYPRHTFQGRLNLTPCFAELNRNCGWHFGD